MSKKSSRMLKILFIGPMGAGKTTAITAISDEPPVSTEAGNSDSNQSVKATTTVAMDYGSIELSEDEVVHLYGIPGQPRFKFMWPILARGALGCIMLLDDTREDPIADLKLYLEEFDELIKSQAFAIGISKTDKSGTALGKYQEYCMQNELYAPIFEVDVREKADVLMLLEIILINKEIKG